MLKRLILGLALLGSTSIFVTSVNAQVSENQKTATQKSAHKKDYTKLKTELGLTDNQVSAWKNLDEQYQPKIQELKANTALTEDAKKAQMKELRTAKKSELKKILSEEQYTKLKSMHGKHKGHHVKDYSKLKTDLSLTDDQVAAWQKLDADYKTKFQGVKTNSSLNEEAKTKEFKALREAKGKELKKILTDDQYKKYKEQCKARKEKKK